MPLRSQHASGIFRALSRLCPSVSQQTNGYFPLVRAEMTFPWWGRRLLNFLCEFDLRWTKWRGRKKDETQKGSSAREKALYLNLWT